MQAWLNGIDGRGLPGSRVVAGFDLSIPLALLNVLLFAALLLPVAFGCRDAAA